LQPEYANKWELGKLNTRVLLALSVFAVFDKNIWVVSKTAPRGGASELHIQYSDSPNYERGPPGRIGLRKIEIV
jgi:hypothetical protein